MRTSRGQLKRVNIGPPITKDPTYENSANRDLYLTSNANIPARLLTGFAGPDYFDLVRDVG